MTTKSSKPILSKVVQDATGVVTSVPVTLTELDGSAFSGTLYDGTGAIVLNPPSSNASGLLEVFTNAARRVLATPSGATAAVVESFDPDPGLGPVHVEEFAPLGTAINTGVVDATSTIQAAMNAAAAGGRELLIGSGTFLVSATLVPPDNLSMRGLGPLTTFKHAAASANPMLALNVANRCHLSNFRLDGNAANNHGFQSYEMFAGGTNCQYEDIEVSNFNTFGIEISGTRCRYARIRAIGQNVAVASYPTIASASNYGSLYGLVCDASPSAVSLGNYWEDLYASGTRSAGIYLGGVNCVAVRPYAENCHRQYYPDASVAPFSNYGGGQMAVSVPGNGTSGLILIAPQVGAAGAGTPATHGIEINGGSYITVVDPVVLSQSSAGISVGLTANVVKILGGISGGNAGEGLTIGNTAANVVVHGIDLISNTTGLLISDSADFIDLSGIGVYANSIANLTNTSSGTHITGRGWRTQNGPAPTAAEQGTPTTTGTGSLGALPIARLPVSAAASAADVINNDLAFHDISGAAVTLGIGQWLVTGTLIVNRDAGANDATSTYQATIVAGTATVVISLAGSYLSFGPLAVSAQGAGSQTWLVKVTAAGTVKLQVRKLAGTGSSAVSTPYTTLTAAYLGNP